MKRKIMNSMKLDSKLSQNKRVVVLLILMKNENNKRKGLL
jgi:hypothetical protein